MNDLNINTTKLDEIRNRVALKALEDEVESQNKAQSIGSAIEAFLNTGALARVHVADNIWAQVGGPNHGIWIAVQRSLGETSTLVDIRLTDWVAWRGVEHSEALTTSGGQYNADVAADTLAYEITLVRADGQVFTSPEPLSALDSTSLRKAIVPLNSGVMLPEKRDHGTIVENVLMALGHGEQERRRAFRRGGWLNDNGMPVFIEPAGAVTPFGYSAAYPMTDLGPGSHESGATSTDIDPREVEAMLRRYRAIAPRRPDLMVGTLGAMGAGALALRNRTSFHIVARSGVGKSNYVSCLQRYCTTVDRNGYNMDFDSTSPSGVQNTLSQLPLVTLDDIRFNDGGTDDFAKIQKFAQGVYQPKGDTKAQQTGRNRETNYGLTGAVGISTSETMPMATGAVALSRRLCIVSAAKGDIDIDLAKAFIGDLSLPGNAVWGAYLRALAMEAHVIGLRQWIADNQVAMTERVASFNERTDAVATVGVIATGWDRFSDWLRSIGVDIDSIVTPTEVEAAFARMLDDSTAVTQEANPVTVIMHRIREKLAGGTAHAATPAGQVPKAPEMFGWTNSGDRWTSNGQLVAYVSEETDSILVTLAAIQKEKRDLGFTALTAEQIVEGLDTMDIVKNDRRSKTRYDKPAASFGFNRKAGAVLPVSWLLGDDDE